jgi:hypothetical protein
MAAVASSARNACAVHYNTPDYLLASCGPIFMVEWRVNTTVEGCAALRKECEKFGRTRPQGIGLLTVIQANAPAPGTTEREAIAGFLRAGGEYIRCSAVVVEGLGFRAAMVRGVVTGLTMLAKQAYPHRVVSLEAGIEMYADVLGGQHRIAAAWGHLQHDIEHLRERCAQELGRGIIAA